MILDSVGLRFPLNRSRVSLVARVGVERINRSTGHSRPIRGITARRPLCGFSTGLSGILRSRTAGVVVLVGRTEGTIAPIVFAGGAVKAQSFALPTILFFIRDGGSFVAGGVVVVLTCVP